MQFYASQWMKLIIFDFLIRAAIFVAFSFNILLIPIAIFISIIHLTIFATLEAIVQLFESKNRFIPYAMAAVSNFIFAVVFIYIWVSFIRSGRQTVCVTYLIDCDWIDGVLLWRGVMTILGITTLQLVVNIIPIALVWNWRPSSVGSTSNS